ncbi:hypothetical protein ACWEFL_17265 [Streptomyces sp. NPDC004838]
MTPPSTPAYRAQVTAEGLVSGSGRRVRVVLGVFSSPYPGRVLRWLRGQALRLADGLDPDPEAGPVHSGALVPVPYSLTFLLGDGPALLRQWADSSSELRKALGQLAGGEPFLLVVSDHSGVYVLTAWSTTPTPAPPHYGRGHGPEVDSGPGRNRGLRPRIPFLTKRTSIPLVC